MRERVLLALCCLLTILLGPEPPVQAGSNNLLQDATFGAQSLGGRPRGAWSVYNRTGNAANRVSVLGSDAGEGAPYVAGAFVRIEDRVPGEIDLSSRYYPFDRTRRLEATFVVRGTIGQIGIGYADSQGNWLDGDYQSVEIAYGQTWTTIHLLGRAPSQYPSHTAQVGVVVGNDRPGSVGYVGQVTLLPYQSAPPVPSIAPLLPFAFSSGVDYGTHFSNAFALQPGTWLEAAYPRVRAEVLADIDELAAQGIGTVRLHTNITGLMRWSPDTGFAGWNEAYLANLDEVLARLRQDGLSVVLVLNELDDACPGSSRDPGTFHYEALDGHHPLWRASYLTALGSFAARYAGNSTVAAADLQNEAYAQLAGSIAGICPDGPDPSGFSPDTIHGWLVDGYAAVKAAAPTMPVTVSDAGPLTRFVGAQLWRGYTGAADFYDVHNLASDAYYPEDLSKVDRPVVSLSVGPDPTDSALSDPRQVLGANSVWLSAAASLRIQAVFPYGWNERDDPLETTIPGGKGGFSYTLTPAGSQLVQLSAANGG